MIQELISVGFVVEFVLDHHREVARAFFMRRVQLAVDAIDARIKILKKEVADLEGCRERLALVGPTVLEIRLSFPDSIDDDGVSSCLLFVFLLLLLHPVHLYISYSTYLACVCNHDATLCYYFYYCYDIEY